MNILKRFCGVLLLAIGCVAFAAEVIPPAPARYFNDYANVISPATATSLNTTLENFERESSSQIVVAIFSKLQSDSSIEDYTFRVKQSWKVGQKGKDNGAALFVFIQDRKMFLQVGYGLEGVLPDALCKSIIADEITPRFRNQDYDGGLSAGVAAILAAAKGEYKGTGRTVTDGNKGQGFPPALIIILFILFVIVIPLVSRGRRGGFLYTGGGWGSSGGGWSSGGGGGGFSGGGGSGGGGGAGGSW